MPHQQKKTTVSTRNFTGRVWNVGDHDTHAMQLIATIVDVHQGRIDSPSNN